MVTSGKPLWSALGIWMCLYLNRKWKIEDCSFRNQESNYGRVSADVYMLNQWPWIRSTFFFCKQVSRIWLPSCTQIRVQWWKRGLLQPHRRSISIHFKAQKHRIMKGKAVSFSLKTWALIYSFFNEQERRKLNLINGGFLSWYKKATLYQKIWIKKEK